jgi:hypothetical protein
MYNNKKCAVGVNKRFKEFSMKKISGTIAMVLVLIMLASSFTGCLSYVYRTESTEKRIVFAIVDIVFLPISLIALLVYIIINDASDGMESQAYLANMDYNALNEYYFLMEKIYSLPEAELASLKQALNSIPEAERISSIERLTSLPETARTSLVSVFNSLPETEIISSLERVTSLSDTERVSLLQNYDSKSEAEVDSLIEELKSLSYANYFALAE